MIRYILLALGLSLSFMSVRNSPSMSRSFNESSPSSESSRPTRGQGHPTSTFRSGYIVASS